MATRYAVASGNWSNTATWDGGTLPASTDDVYANNFTVNIDQSVTVNTLKKISNGSPAIAAGGSFVVTTAATINITAGIAAADNVTNGSVLVLVDAGSAAVTINAPSITAGAGSGRTAVRISDAFTGSLTINANLTGGSSSARALENQGAPNAVTIVGNLLGGAGGVAVDLTGGTGGGSVNSLSVTGNVTGGSGSGHGMVIGSSSAVTGTITGNVTGGASTTFGMNVTSNNALVTIVGDVSGGTALNAYGVYLDLGKLTVRGNIRPGSWSVGAYALFSSWAARLRVSGDIWAGGVSGTAGPNGWFPIHGTFTAIEGEDLEMHLFNDADFPTSNAGDPVTFAEGGGGGGTIPESGVLWPPRYWA